MKLGQPVPDSNLSRELNSGSPVATSTYRTVLCLSRIVVERRLGGLALGNLYSSGLSFWRSSASVGFLYILVHSCWGQRPRLALYGERARAATHLRSQPRETQDRTQTQSQKTGRLRATMLFPTSAGLAGYRECSCAPAVVSRLPPSGPDITRRACANERMLGRWRGAACRPRHLRRRVGR